MSLNDGINPQRVRELEGRIAELESIIAELDAVAGGWMAQKKRIAELESLARDLFDNLWVKAPKCAESFEERMRELGLEV